MRILLKNGIIVNMIGDIQVADLLIEENKIRKIGKLKEEADKVLDVTGKIVMPGLINAHTHVGMALFRGYSDELELMDWLTKKIWPIEDKMKAEDVYYSSLLSGIEMIKSGTTTMNDQYFFEEETAKAAELLGMRAMLSRCIIQDGEQAKVRVEEARALYQNWNNRANGRIQICVGPHAPYTCSPETIEESVKLAKEWQVPIHIHYLETKDEVNQMSEKYQETTTQYLERFGVFDVPVILAHGVWLTNEDIQKLKTIRGGVVHNPVSNQKLGSGIAPICELMAHQIPVALGTDGQGSTNTLDMFEEIKAASYLQKVSKYNATAISAYDVLKMATIDGARVLGMEDRIGSLEEGKLADIIIIDVNKPHLCPIHDIYSLLAYSVNGADVESVIIDGNIVMENRKIQNVEEQEVMRKCREISKVLFKN